jgi:long-chain acyl-CoA synthetase
MAGEPMVTDVGLSFRRHEILLTGASGFVGKVVLGLFLDRYPDLKHLHVLVRGTRELSAGERFAKDILGSPALAAAVEELGEKLFRDKITVWPGDVSQPLLGLPAEGLERMAGHVGVIINCAGRVDFFPPVSESFASNVTGVEHVVELARKLNAKLLHISTGFVSGKFDGLVEETEPILGYYPHRNGPGDRSFDHAEEIRYCREQIRLIEESSGANGEAKASRERVARLTALGRRRAEHWGWVNTYTYAKSLGEQIIAAEPDLDYAIVRPAIVESSLRFPFPGWIEGGRTAAPLVLMALGGMKAWPVRRDMPLEVVPVDLVASAVLAIAALLLEGRHEHVYHLATADVNPIHLEPLVRLLDAESRKRKMKNGQRGPSLAWLDPQRRLRFVSMEQARARRAQLERRVKRMQGLLEKVRRVPLPGKKSLAGLSTALRTLELQAKFREQTLDQYLPFILHNRYIFECENIRAAQAHISERDRKLLPWDPEHINWKDYWVHHQIGGIERWVQPDAVKDWMFRI